MNDKPQGFLVTAVDDALGGFERFKKDAEQHVAKREAQVAALRAARETCVRDLARIDEALALLGDKPKRRTRSDAGKKREQKDGAK